MATTTTWAAIRTRLTTRLKQNVTPSSQAEKLLDECPTEFRIREWAEKAGATAFRKFQWESVGWTAPAQSDPDAYERNETVVLTIAYPVGHGLYDSDSNSSNYNTMEDVIDADVTSVLNLLHSGTNYLEGQSECRLINEPKIDRGENVWLVDLTFVVTYTHSMSLSFV